MTSTFTPQLSIIIPTLNEAAALPNLLTALTLQQDIRSQIIVADGGSNDDTLTIAANHPDVELVRSNPGRGEQMNNGAAAAKADWLLFLHADSLIEDSALLINALTSATPELAGHFSLKFFDRPAQSLKYSVLEAKTSLTRENTSNGDQGLLIHRALFKQVGGFSTRWHFLEDQALNESLRKQGRLTCLSGHLYTSARRFESEGFKSRYLLMTLIMTAWHCGLHEFIDNARDGYKTQSDTSQLSLLPFAKLFTETHRKRPWNERLRLLVAYGSYARANSWQAFLWLGFLLGKTNSHRVLALHDRGLAPILGLPLIKQVVDVCLGILVCSIIFYIGPALLRLHQVIRR